MARKSLRIKPLSHILDLSEAPLNASPLAGQWPCLNVMVSSNRITRRWDHEIYRTFGSTETIQSIPIFRTAAGVQYTLVLTDTDLAKIMGGSGETYQYLTDTYTTGTITGISSTAVSGSGTNWATSGLAAGDKFIMTTDLAAAVEPDANWATIASVGTDTSITLTADAYTGATTTGTYKARKVYSCPTGERWQSASVNGKFCFGNSAVYMQYWTGSGYAANLDITYCNKVKYCVPYANRLVTANMYDGDTSAVNPWKVRWSKEGDPTNWTDDTSGFNDFIDTEEPIAGLGVSGDNIIVFKGTSYYIGYRTGQATNPIAFPGQKKGIGLYAPYSLVHVAGTIAWMGIDDFYYLNGDVAEPVGGPIRKKFFDLVSDDEAQSVFGINNLRYNEVLWVANTSSGQYNFAKDWKEKSWQTYQFPSNFTGLGGFGF